jgi:hypothetical protein
MPYINDTNLPSVSDIIRPYIDTKWFTDESRVKGTCIHACCASYIQGLYFPKLKSEYQGYMDSFKKWADKNIEDVILVEERLVDEDSGYCGQLDCVLRLKEHEKLFIVDLKTGKAMQRSHKLQLAAYLWLYALSDVGDIPKRDVAFDAYHCITLRIKSNGTGCLAARFLDNQYNFDIFKGMLSAHKFFNDKVARMHNMEKI